MTESLVPVSCSLAEDHAASRVEEWSELVGRSAAIETLPNGVRLRLPIDLAACATNLAERESECCGFLDIDLLVADRDLILEMTSTNPGAWPVISALTGVARS